MDRQDAWILPLALAVATLASAPAWAAGRAEVRFNEPARYSDAGFGPYELQRTQREMQAIFERLAQRLPDGQVLQVQIDDIDLAGEVEPFLPNQPRVMGRLPDAPRLAFRFELVADGRVLASGQERLIDAGYLDRRTGLDRLGALPYEERLVQAWYRERLMPSAR